MPIVQSGYSPKALIKPISGLFFLISLLSVCVVVYDIGFRAHDVVPLYLDFVYLVVCFSGIAGMLFRYLFKSIRPTYNAIVPDVLLIVYLGMMLLHYYRPELGIFPFNEGVWWTYLAALLVFVRELSALKINVKKAAFNPAQIFVISFLLLIVAGSFLLLLPNATNHPLSFPDALFTSASAVCVTGLTVVDTGTHFTLLGQVIILVLIQAGGIGIMTFASYFSYFFRGNVSYHSQIALREMTQTEKMGEVFSVLRKVIWITLIIEALGAVLIYSIIGDLYPETGERIFFAIFHSVSAFCNAGFSTLPDNLAGNIMQYEYSLHLIIAGLLILGGLGFPILFNVLQYLRTKSKNLIFSTFGKKPKILRPRIMSINSRLVLITSLALTLGGALVYFIFEYHNTLSEHSLFGKIVVSFFSSSTTRTAGYNVTDTAEISLPVTLFMMFLMWIGASPGSTGGGIKTTTFALAILSIRSAISSKTRLDVFHREISPLTINRAGVIIMLSLMANTTSVILLTFTDPHLPLLDLVYESISAYSTVGLSRGITASLSDPGKLIITLTMFAGRISMLNLLIALTRKKPMDHFRYPSETLSIN